MMNDDLVCACVQSCVCVCVGGGGGECSACHNEKKAPDEWQAREAIPVMLQVSGSKHNAKKSSTRARGLFHQSCVCLLIQTSAHVVIAWCTSNFVGQTVKNTVILTLGCWVQPLRMDEQQIWQNDDGYGKESCDMHGSWIWSVRK